MPRLLLRWYDRHKRDLPWRVANGDGRPDPYHVLVSEAMLQQTQVATVVPYFHRFLEAFPTIEALAAADEQRVLRLWQGLGYYARARHLLAAARAVVAGHGGALPAEVEELLNLPGIGRYTAGAIASIAFGRRAAIVDGNVARVICRLDAIAESPALPRVRERIWRRSEQFLPRKRVGDFNSALMELGATVCTPRNPRCGICPLQRHCRAHATGVAGQLPAPRPRPKQPLERRRVYCIQYRGRWLIEQRPRAGRWAGMWQFVTMPMAADEDQWPQACVPGWLPGHRGPGPTAADLLRERCGVAVNDIAPLTTLHHTLTHRRYEFEVFHCTATARGDAVPHRKWARLAELPNYPLPAPHARIARLLGGAALRGR